MQVVLTHRVAQRLASEYVAARNARSSGRLAALLAPDAEYGEFGEGVVFFGREAVVRRFAAVAEAVPDLSLALTAHPTCAGDYVVCRWVMTGTPLAAFAGIAPAGRPFRVEGVTVLVTEGRRITRAVDCFDVRALPGWRPPSTQNDPSASACLPGPLFHEDNIWHGE